MSNRATALGPRWKALAVAVGVTVVLAAGCAALGDEESPPRSAVNPDRVASAAPVNFSGPGPYPVGTVPVDLGDRAAVVYYPADPSSLAGAEHFDGYSTALAWPADVRSAVPPAFEHQVDLGTEVYRRVRANSQGPFPVVLYSHRLGDFYLFESRFMTHLASWGFVVAAPDHAERSRQGQLDPANASRAPGQDVTDLKNTLARLKDANVDSEGVLQGAMNLEAVAVAGQAVGAAAALRLAGDSPEVKTFIGITPQAPVDLANLPRDVPPDQQAAAVALALAPIPPPDKPSMLIASEADPVVPVPLVISVYDWLAPPKRLAVVHNAGHNAVSDLCAAIRDQGEQGCPPTSLDPAEGYAYIGHLTVAQLRWVFGFDATAVSLAPAYLQATFPSAFGAYRADP